MLTTIKGTYYNGIITLNEPAPDVDNSQVLITFIDEPELTPQQISILEQRLKEDPATYLTAQNTIDHLSKKYGL
jgi:hypothetical protein